MRTPLSRREFLGQSARLAAGATAAALAPQIALADTSKAAICLSCRDVHLRQVGPKDAWSAIDALGADGVEATIGDDLSLPVLLHSSRKYTTADGQQKEETVWFRVSVWGKQAEPCNQYLSKGRKVLVEGTLVPDENGGPRVWTDKEGKPRASFEVRATTVRFLDSKREGTPGAAAGAAPEGAVEEQPTTGEELPF